MAVCEKCASDDLTLVETLEDGRLRVSCGSCGHSWIRGTSRPSSSSRAGARTAKSTGPPPGGASAVNERAIAAVVAELARRGAETRVERRGNRKEIIARGPGSNRDVVIMVRARTRGDWQAQASAGRVREPEAESSRFWIMVDLFADATNYYVVPEWWIQNDIHDKHQQYLAHHGGTRPLNEKSDTTKIETKRVVEWLDRWDQLSIFDPAEAPPG